ncbi:GerMN domain-containing protein [Nonomuraea aurantiaca]|uniref:GerMN domain-containing protein n=1 Tax=Nonomuraea aurantiaca TaxID=2878562 RepID=UPI001CD95CEF|nr:GerMN domain-containing protein [Nonomuraea aurantiaca]MCA2226455.1 GerMN domain-containing protein [Nonomuraea aurantiaca]
MPKNESEHMPGVLRRMAAVMPEVLMPDVLRRVAAVMPRVLCRMAAVLIAAATLAGCGITDTDALPAGQPARGGLTENSSRLLRVYFVTPQGTWPVSRPASAGDRLRQAMDALLAGPTAAERARGLITRLPSATRPIRARTTNGRVELRLPWLVRDLRPVAVSQLVCTAAAVPGLGDDPVIKVFEPGLADPWPVRCDESGSAVPDEQGAPS